MIPQDDNDDRSIEVGSNPNAALTVHLHAQAAGLQYLTFTCPNLTYAVQWICLHMHDPRELHLTAMKRTLRSLWGTLDYGLLLRRFASSKLTVYTDADWAGCPDTHWSTSGYAIFLGTNLVSWSSKHQNIISRSSTEAE
jgi:hypothetical protein